MCVGRRDAGHNAAALASAYDREYNDDHSWEQLQEDEHGRLIKRARTCVHTCTCMQAVTC